MCWTSDFPVYSYFFYCAILNRITVTFWAHWLQLIWVYPLPRMALPVSSKHTHSWEQTGYPSAVNHHLLMSFQCWWKSAQPTELPTQKVWRCPRVQQKAFLVPLPANSSICDNVQSCLSHLIFYTFGSIETNSLMVKSASKASVKVVSFTKPATWGLSLLHGVPSNFFLSTGQRRVSAFHPVVKWPVAIGLNLYAKLSPFPKFRGQENRGPRIKSYFLTTPLWLA